MPTKLTSTLDMTGSPILSITPSGSDFELLLCSLKPRFDQTPICAVWSERPVIALARDAKPKLIVPKAGDPHRDTAGRAVLPTAERAYLRRLSHAGMQFPQLAVVHDLDANGPVMALMETLRRTPVMCSDTVAAEVLGPLPAHPGVKALAGTLDRCVAGARMAARSTVRVASGLVPQLLDPVVLGVSTPAGDAPEHGEPPLWHPLVAWWW
jgi:hypothetical protein